MRFEAREAEPETAAREDLPRPRQISQHLGRVTRIADGPERANACPRPANLVVDPQVERRRRIVRRARLRMAAELAQRIRAREEAEGLHPFVRFELANLVSQLECARGVDVQAVLSQRLQLFGARHGVAPRHPRSVIGDPRTVAMNGPPHVRGCARMPRFMRAPLWLILLIVLAIIGLGVYGYFTTPLPLGLGAVIKTPGGTATAAQTPVAIGVPAGTRTAAGQPLVLGATNVVVQAVQRNQDLTASGRGGPVGAFTVVQIEIRNGGSEPLSALASSSG